MDELDNIMESEELQDLLDDDFLKEAMNDENVIVEIIEDEE